MIPVVVDPATYDREEAWKDAQRLLEFCDQWPFPRPWVRKCDGRKLKGWYSPSTNTVSYSFGRTPVRTPGYSWSFTGYKADLTSYGILAHELGHWWHFQEPRRDDITLAARLLAMDERAVSGYEPNAHETIAEAVRLFILNPDLLRCGRPKRYAYLESMGMRPLHDLSWREVLANAHPKLVRAAERWIQ